MAGPPFEYTGGAEMWYPSYLDAATGKMLMAEPGQSYTMTGINGTEPVPPTDDRWQAATAVTTPAAPVQSAPPAPAPQGGVN